jgi:hypothetical protein
LYQVLLPLTQALTKPILDAFGRRAMLTFDIRRRSVEMRE